MSVAAFYERTVRIDPDVWRVPVEPADPDSLRARQRPRQLLGALVGLACEHTVDHLQERVQVERLG
jgi:hypothetical protein